MANVSFWAHRPDRDRSSDAERPSRPLGDHEREFQYLWTYMANHSESIGTMLGTSTVDIARRIYQIYGDSFKLCGKVYVWGDYGRVGAKFECYAETFVLPGDDCQECGSVVEYIRLRNGRKYIRCENLECLWTPWLPPESETCK